MEKKLPRVVLSTRGTDGEWPLRIVEYDDGETALEHQVRNAMNQRIWTDCEQEDFLDRLCRSLCAGGLE